MPADYCLAAATVAISTLLLTPLVHAQTSASAESALSIGANDAAISTVEVFVDARDVRREFDTVFSADPDEAARSDESKRILNARTLAVSAGADAVIVGVANRAPDMGPTFKGLQKRLQPGSVVGIKYKEVQSGKKKK